MLNSSACTNCHARDGRANFSAAALAAAPDLWTKLGPEAGIFLRLGIPAESGDCAPSLANRYCAPRGVPGFSTQLFHRSVLDVRPDAPFSGLADVWVRFETRQLAYGDGTPVTLYRPIFQIRNPYDNPGEVPSADAAPVSRLLQPDVATSPRMGMPVFGLGLLEAIAASDILALADPDAREVDGTSVRPNVVFEPVKQS